MKTRHSLEVVNAFRSFHISYIANQYKVFEGLRDKFNLCDHEIKIISASVDLLDSLREGVRYNYVTGERVSIWLGHKYRSNRTYEMMGRLVEKGYLIIKEFKRNKRGVISKRYILDPKAYLICEEYSRLMLKWYKANYFTDRIDRELKEIYGLMGFRKIL